MRALVFDLDGTLVDSREDIVAAIRAALREVEASCVLSASELGALVGRPLGEMLSRAAPSLGNGGVDTAAACYRAHYAAHCQERSRLYPGIAALFEALPGGLRIGCATTKRPDQTRIVLEAFGLVERLHGWRGTAPEMAFKPAPDVLLAIASDLGVPAEEMWYVGDTAGDLLAARAAGAAGVWAAWGYGDRDSCLEARPLHVIDSPADLVPLLAS